MGLGQGCVHSERLAFGLGPERLLLFGDRSLECGMVDTGGGGMLEWSRTLPLREFAWRPAGDGSTPKTVTVQCATSEADHGSARPSSSVAVTDDAGRERFFTTRRWTSAAVGDASSAVPSSSP